MKHHPDWIHCKGLCAIRAISSRKRKKTISLCVGENSEIVVRFPIRMDQVDVENFILSKRAWLQNKFGELTSLWSNAKNILTFNTDAPYLGQRFPLRFSGSTEDKMTSPLCFTGREFILPQEKREEAKTFFIAWYKTEARRICEQSIRRYSVLLNKTPRKIRITSAKRRWGSCSTNNTLSFTWRIAMLPPEIIDYIVVHELTHLTHKNHGAFFWEEVSRTLRDYRRHNAWLKANGRLYAF